MANNAQLLLPSCMDDLSRGSNSLRSPEPYQKKLVSGAAPNPEGFKPGARYGSTLVTCSAQPLPKPVPTTGSGGAGVGVFRPKLSNQYRFVNPVQPQETSSSRASPRTGMVPRHQNQLLPFGLMGASRGTGVFHPQHRVPPTDTVNKTMRNKREVNNTKQEVRVTPQRNSSKMDSGLEKQQEEHRQHLLSEVGLPNEWTY